MGGGGVEGEGLGVDFGPPYERVGKEKQKRHPQKHLR